MAVVEHGTVFDARRFGCEMFQVGVVGGNYPFRFRFVQVVQQGFCNGSPQHGLCTCAEFVDQDQGIGIRMTDEVFHVDKC